MKHLALKLFALALCGVLLCSAALAATPKTSPTPAPQTVPEDVLDTVPEKIQQLLDLAYGEWEAATDKSFSRVNKYTEWRGKGVGFGWCGGFITWCMMQLDVPMEEVENIPEGEVTGIVHVKEASVGKLLRGYLKMYRSTRIPQKGFLVVYGAQSYNRTNHIGLVVDVQRLDSGVYRITSIEGNMGSTVKMFVHDYDPLAKETSNLTMVPKAERTESERKNFSYKIPTLQGNSFWINCFLMPYLPEEGPAPAEEAPTEAAPDNAEALEAEDMEDEFLEITPFETPPPQRD